jgi:5-methylcytosine-specific restriction protein A
MSPYAALRPCSHPGCGQLVDSSAKRGKCEKHRLREQREYDAQRPPALVAFYHSREWRALRRQVFHEEPFCVLCQARGLVALTQQIDHILSVKTHWELRLVRSNCRGLCLSCHRSVTREAESKQPRP